MKLATQQDYSISRILIKKVKTHGMVILRTMVYNAAKENNGIDWSVTKSISVELLMQNWLKFEMLF